jgi:sugar/nucleoside kinase (ribokinase family)
MSTALIAGHICIDLIPAVPSGLGIVPGELVNVGPMTLRAGGCVANTATALADLGANVRVIAGVGDDDLGAALRRQIRERLGGDVGLVTVSGASTSYSIVLEPPGSDRTFWHHIGANADFDDDMVSLADTDLLHLGYPQLLPRLIAHDGARLQALLQRAKSATITTSLDFAAVRPDGSEPDWRAILKGVLPAADIVTPSVDDLVSMLGTTIDNSRSSLSSLAGELIALGAAVVMLTAGPQGALLRTGSARRLAAAGPGLAGNVDEWADCEIFAPAAATRVISTTGAGDAATAGLLYGVLRGLAPNAALSLAMDTAALRVSGRAANGNAHAGSAARRAATT